MRSARAVPVWCRLLLLVAVAWAAAPLSASAQTPAATRTGHVYLLRGLANVFSLGMDTLAQKLAAQGVTASVRTYGEWQTLAASAVEESRAAGGRPAPIIIIGHSLGADAAIYMANRVIELGGPVPLVVTFDPVTPRLSASPKIGKVVNYYQSTGSGKAVLGGNVSNIDMPRDGNMSHFNIEKAADLHNQTIALVLKSTGSAVARKPRRKPVAAPPAPTQEVAPSDAATAPGAAPSGASPQAAATPISAPAASAATPAATPAAATSAAPAAEKPASPM